LVQAFCADSPTMLSHISDDTKQRTLWIGDLENWMQESFMLKVFSPHADIDNVKIVRDRMTNQSQGYAFVEFATRAGACKVFETCNCVPMPAADGHRFRVNWSFSSLGSLPHENPHASLWVGPLDENTRDPDLYKVFHEKFSSCVTAKVIVDTNGVSKGYGFVHFQTLADAERALVEMQGKIIGTKVISVKVSMNKHQQRAWESKLGCGRALDGGFKGTRLTATPSLLHSRQQSLEKTVHVLGLEADVGEVQMCRCLGVFGNLVAVRHLPGDSVGTVEFGEKAHAEQAMILLGGYRSGANRLNVRWSEAFAKYAQLCAQLPPYSCEIETLRDQLRRWQEEPSRDASASLPTWSWTPEVTHFQLLLQDPEFVSAFEKQLDEHEMQVSVAVPTTSRSVVFSETHGLLRQDCDNQMDIEYVSACNAIWDIGERGVPMLPLEFCI